MTDDRDRISNRRCVNEADDVVYVTDDKNPGIRTTLHLCTGHCDWLNEHMDLTAIDPTSLN